MGGFPRMPRMTAEDVKHFWDRVDKARAEKYAAKPQWEKREGGRRIITGWWTCLMLIGRMR